MTRKESLRLGGVGLFLVGLMCLPIGLGANPKRDLSTFHNFADLGVFLRYGGLLMGAGVLLMLLSLISCPPCKREDSKMKGNQGEEPGRNRKRT